MNTESEKRQLPMKAIQREEIQPLLLSMLKAFDSFSKKNNIEYYVAGGTLLGTIRHHGFIPWDDDIDLFIREDMADKICSIARENPFIDDDRRYKILLPATIPNVYPIFKLVDTHTVVYERNISKKYACGLWIDIFKMSYWPDDLEQSKKLFAKQQRIKKWLQLSIFGNLKDVKYKLVFPVAVIAKGILFIFGKNCEYWSSKLYRLGSRKKTGFIGNLSWAAAHKDRYPIDWYNSSIEMIFEDVTVPVPAAYDKILTQFYGNYMQLPPENQRIRHDFDAYYIDRIEA